MATVLNDDEEQNQAQTTNQGSVSPVGGSAVHLAPQAGNIGGTAGGSANTPGSIGERNGTGPVGGQFATLNQYVDANSPNAEQLANQVLTPIQGQIGQSQADITNTESDINKQISQGYTPFQDYGSQLTRSNVEQFTADPSNVSNFQKQLNDQYTGPSSVEGANNYQNLLANLQNQQAAGRASTSSTAGQENLLKNVETTVPNNQGVTALNEAILSHSPDYQSRVEQAYQPYSNLISGLQNFAGQGDQSIATGQQQAQQASQTANKEINDAVQNENQQIQQNLANATANQNQFNQNLGTVKNAANQANSAIQSFLASNPNIYNGTANGPLAPWLALQEATNAPTLAGVATPQDFAVSKALQTLNPNAQMALNPADAAQAGTYQAPTLPGGNLPGAVSQELQGFGSQIQNAIAPFQKQEQIYSQASAQADQANKAWQDAQNGLRNAGVTLNRNGQFTNQNNTNLSTAQQQAVDTYKQAQQQYNAATQTMGGAEGTEQALAPNLQWVPGAGQAYNNLISQLNTELAPLSNLSANAPQANQQGTSIPGNAVMGAFNPLALQANLGLQGLSNTSLNSQELSPLLNLQTLGIPTNILSGVGGDITKALSSIGSLFGGIF